MKFPGTNSFVVLDVAPSTVEDILLRIETEAGKENVEYYVSIDETDAHKLILIKGATIALQYVKTT